MLRTVVVSDIRGDSLTFPLHDLGAFTVSNIDGIGPVKAAVNVSDFASVDGGQLQSIRGGVRNITMSITINSAFDGTSVAELRHLLYKFFMVKAYVKLSFVDSDGSIKYAEGYVESCDSPQFVQNPTADISIICTDPYFYSDSVVENTGVTVVGSADSWTDIDYDGDTASGFLFQMVPGSTSAALRIRVRNRTLSGVIYRDETFSFSTIDASLASTALTISTVSGDKFARAYSGTTVYTDCLKLVSPTTKWPELQPGLNQVRVSLDTAGVPWSLAVNNKFGGL